MIVLALRYPSCTIIQYSQIVLGKWLGKLVGLIYIAFSILLASAANRDFSELFLSFLYPYTPILIITLIIVVASAYALTVGLPLIARSAELLVPFLLFVIFFGILASIPNMHLSALSLVLENGWQPVVKDAVTELPWLGLAFYWLFLVPQLKIKATAKKTLPIALLIVSIITFFIAVTIVAVLGPYIPPASNYQFYSILRLIRIGGFIERIEPIFLLSWAGSSFLVVSIFYYTALASIKEFFNLRTYRPAIIPVGTLIIYLSIKLFPSYMDLRSFFSLERFGLIALPVEFGIPLLILIVGYLRGK